jgi:hypothetical protein
MSKNAYYCSDESEPELDPNLGTVGDYTLKIDGDMLFITSGNKMWHRELPDIAKARLAKESLRYLSAHERIIVRVYQQHRMVVLHFEDFSVNVLVGLVKKPQ